ncbi:hypothetical protein C2U69_33845 [Cupriavidus pinatubonensis]|nr:hypothetical protein C2U69_33845 [Cupriavidus pinatubonensis]
MAKQEESILVKDLRHQLDEARRQLHNLKAADDRGADYIARLTSGCRTTYGAEIDVLTASGHTLEVKYSSALLVDRLRKTGARRWAWSRLRGNQGYKRYDYLILLGEKDARYAYPQGDYVIFCISFADVTSRLSKKVRWLQCGTSLRGRWAREMTERWMVTPEEITGKFRRSEPGKTEKSRPSTAKVLLRRRRRDLAQDINP